MPSDIIGQAFVRIRPDTGNFSSELNTNLNRAADNASKTVGSSFLKVGAGIAAGFGLAIKVTADFEKTISEVGAVSGATGEELNSLRDSALEAGKATVFSASEAAQAQAELAKAGISTADILGGALRGALDLAAAGQLELGDAATIAAQAMNVFDLEGKDVARIADVLAAGANRSAADIKQLGDALRQGGLLAKQTGLSLEDTVGTLALFADNALIGSDAGTSLKTMLQRLTPESEKAKKEMKDLGISAYDSQGNFVGLEKFAENLKTSLSRLDPQARDTALGIIFGSDAVRGATLLYEAGAEGVREYVDAVSEQGVASEIAGKKLDNLSGDLEALKGSLETALIESGSEATGVLRFMVQGATAAVNVFADLPGPVQAAGIGFTAVTGAGLLVIGTLGSLIPKVKEVHAALVTLSATSKTAQVLLTLESALGKVLAAAGRFAPLIGIGVATVAWMDDLYDVLQKFLYGGANLDKTAESLTKLGRATDPTSKELDKLRGAVEKHANLDYQSLWDNVRRINEIIAFGEPGPGNLESRLKEIDKALADLVTGGNIEVAREAVERLAGGLDKYGITTSAQLVENLPKYEEALGKVQNQADLTATAQDNLTRTTAGLVGPTLTVKTLTGEHATSISELEAKAESAGETLDQFRSQIEQLVLIHVNAEQASIAWEAAIDKVTESVAEQGRTFDIDTEAGRTNREAILGVVEASARHVEALLREGATTEQVNATLTSQRDHLRRVLEQIGLNSSEIDRYIGFLNSIPISISTRATIDTRQAHDALARLRADIQAFNRLEIFGNINVRGSAVPRFQSGGIVPGPRGRPRLVIAHGGERIEPLSRSVFAERREQHQIPTHTAPQVTRNYYLNVQGQLVSPITEERLAEVLRRLELLAS